MPAMSDNRSITKTEKTHMGAFFLYKTLILRYNDSIKPEYRRLFGKMAHRLAVHRMRIAAFYCLLYRWNGCV